MQLRDAYPEMIMGMARAQIVEQERRAEQARVRRERRRARWRRLTLRR